MIEENLILKSIKDAIKFDVTLRKKKKIWQKFLLIGLNKAAD